MPGPIANLFDVDVNWTDHAGEYHSVGFDSSELANSALKSIRYFLSGKSKGLVLHVGSACYFAWAWTKDHKRTPLVGEYRSEREAQRGVDAFVQSTHRAPVGPPVRFRVVGIYANDAERELTAFAVAEESETYDRGVGFVTDDEEFCVFVARRPREQESTAETPQTILDKTELPF